MGSCGVIGEAAKESTIEACRVMSRAGPAHGEDGSEYWLFDESGSKSEIEIGSRRGGVPLYRAKKQRKLHV